MVIRWRHGPNAIWWHVYPLGFTGAEKAQLAAEEPVRHRLRQLEGWLDYAVELGCSGLLLGPVFAAGTHGYDTIDHFQIDPRLGDQDDFDHLVAEAGRRGLRIVLDGVFNHVGRSFPAFQAALAGGPGSPAARWFRYDPAAGEYATFEGHHQLVAWITRSPRSRLRRAGHDLLAGPGRGGMAARRRVRGAGQLLGQGAAGRQGGAPGRVVPRRDDPRGLRGLRSDSGLDSITQYELWKAIWSSLNDPNFYELAWALDGTTRCSMW